LGVVRQSEMHPKFLTFEYLCERLEYMNTDKKMKIKNNISVDIKDIEFLTKADFHAQISRILSEKGAHCIAYFAVKDEHSYSFFCGIANDFSHDIDVEATRIGLSEDMDSFVPEHNCMHIFEREIHEQHGVRFGNHPWLKPVRYSFGRYDKEKTPDNYPFFTIEGDELHEVGVGPIHAGIIEPGHFRFICEGEKVLHLEIVLGYQHRGVESMMQGIPDIRKMLLSETIASDSTVAHSLAYVSAIEALSGFVPDERLQLERCIALALSRSCRFNRYRPPSHRTATIVSRNCLNRDDERKSVEISMKPRFMFHTFIESNFFVHHQMYLLPNLHSTFVIPNNYLHPSTMP
jgi:NADH:ubiquinone oxidoreductase subunit C